MKKFVIYTNPNKDKDLKVSVRVRDLLKEKGCECEFFGDYKGRLDKEVMLIVLGGDGTILRAIRDAGLMECPVIGINLGTLGFLTEIELSNLEESLTRLVNDDFRIEKRMLLEGKIGDNESGWALNDIVLTRHDGLHILNFNISVNDRPLADYAADGIILSTPTGSTGYNLSAGGPIAAPSSELIILTPICPHTLSHRSIILSCGDVVKIEIPESGNMGRQEMEVSFDGSFKRTVSTGDVITVKKSDVTVDFALLGKDSFVEVLNRKMK